MSGYLSAMRNYATFSGRASRGAYWRAHYVFIPLMLVAFVGVGLPFARSRSLTPALLFLILIGPHVVPWAALTARRLHDMDQSGHWAVLALTPINVGMPLGIVGLMVWCGFDGIHGPNRFGPDPLGRAPLPEPPMTAPVAAISGPPTSDGPAPPRDVIDELERLGQLRASGSLSEAEFEALKAKALGWRAPA